MLKKSVKIMREKNITTVQYALWAVDLPNQWIQDNINIKNILNNSYKEFALDNCTPEEINVINLLREQGCFEEENKDYYSGNEILIMYKHVINLWYSKYYQHPIWNRLINGCSINQFVAWLIQNYHLSRSAGVTDSRCALFLPKKDMRNVFKQNAIEEYWHCDAFYFVNHPKLCISREETKRYIPLRSSIAFDQQMLRLAEEDPLAYIMVSYFQENSANFYNDCQDFYNILEKKYEIEGLFQPWIKHLSFDFEYDHGDRYGELFLEFNHISKKELLQSFENAAITIGYLFEVFDEILSQPDQDTIVLRNPIDGQKESQVLLDLFGKTDYEFINIDNQIDNIILSDFIINSYYQNNLLNLKLWSLTEDNIKYIQEKISHSAFRGMSFSSVHDEILTLGCIAQSRHTTNITSAYQPKNKSEWAALINYVYECSHKPEELIVIIYLFNKLFKMCYAIEIFPNQIQVKIEKYIKNHSVNTLRYLNSIASLLENFTKFSTKENIFYQHDLLKD